MVPGQRAGLGHEFVRTVDAEINAIRRDPEMSGFIERHFRASLLRRFPFQIVYAYADGTVMIYAVFHTSRDPEKLRRRLR